MPELHVVAAGSLLDFAIQKVGVPVGRVQFLYMYPLSFIEFLAATGHNILIKEILEHPINKEISKVMHDETLNLLAQYLAIGGMPQAVACWKDKLNLHSCSHIPQTLVEAYKYDFIKYGKSHQIKYLELLFSHIPQQFGRKFKYSKVGEFRKRDLEPCLELLITAGIIHRVMHSDAQGIPLGAQADLDAFKLFFIDIGLSQFTLNCKTGDWLLNPLDEFINKGMLVESFVGQEFIAYEYPSKKAQLYYWKRDARGSEAEVDYVIQQGREIIPIEVKSGSRKALKSMHLFLEKHPNSPYGIRFSTNNYSVYNKIYSYPLYAIAKLFAAREQEILNSLLSLLE